MMSRQYVVFAEYLNSNDCYDLQLALVDNGFDYDTILVKTQKELLAKFGYQKKGHCAFAVSEPALKFLESKFSTVNAAEIVL